MKKKLGCLLLAASMIFGNIGVVSTYADNVWQSGWTGAEGGSDFTVTANGSTVVLENTKANNGKFTNEEDSIIYYATKADVNTDFTLSATVNIDAYSMFDDSSNSHQGSIGIGIIDELYNKTDTKKYTDGVYLGTFSQNKDSDMNISTIVRDNSDQKTPGNALSDKISPKGENLGTFDLSITKSGNDYTLTCGDKSQTIEMDNFETEIYPCLYIARNAKATFTNVNYSVNTNKAVALTLNGTPKTQYFVGDDFSTDGLNGVITYADGSTKEVKSYLVKGFNSSETGTQTVTLSSEDVSATLDVTVSPMEIVALDVVTAPYKTRYAKNEVLNIDGLEVQATFSNGSKKTLNPQDFTFKIDSRDVNPYEYGELTIDNMKGIGMVYKPTKLQVQGRKNVEVVLSKLSGYTTTKTATFQIEVSNQPVSSLTVNPPLKTVYYLGENFDKRGMEVLADYKTINGADVTELLNSDEYDFTGFSSDEVGTKTITVTAVSNPDVKTTFDVEVRQRQSLGIKLLNYPRTTYAVGESFDETDMEVARVYDSGDIEDVEYSVDTSEFNTSAVGSTSVKITANGEKSIEVPITVVESFDNKWRESEFGQASDYGAEGDAKVTADEYGTVNGKINVRNWNGSGKITNDHDGITYYYTSVPADKDFKLSADITVNKYLEHDNDDTKRNGQEAFGVMLRDVIPLADADGNVVIDENMAKTDNEGVAVPANSGAAFSSNMAIFGGYSGAGWPTDPTKSSYDKNRNVNRINVLVREGVEATDGGGERIGPYAISSDFPSEGNKYRLTIERLNGGLYAKCYNYQRDEVMEQYYYDDTFLFTQNKDNYYVGFFGSRWADIDVSDVKFYETSRATDPMISDNESKQIAPQFTFKDKPYTTNEEYTFKLGLTSGVKGRVTVKMNNNIIAQDQEMTKATDFTAKLNKDSVNKLVAVFTPSDAVNLTSYEPIEIKADIYHKTPNPSPEIYASPEGSFDGNGSYDNPYDITTAFEVVQPGQTAVLKEGVYYLDDLITIYLGDNGKENAYKTVKAEDGKKVAVDGRKEVALVSHSGDYWHIQNIEFRNSGENLKGYHLGGSNNIIEGCSFHDNGDIGFQMSRVSGSQPYWPFNNIIKDCEAYNNCDPSKINADGFGAKLTIGEGNKFINCKSHHNVDDGWDLYTKMNSGAIGAVTLIDCEAYKNGIRLNEDGTETPFNAGGNNGFKMGGENVAVQHILINCKAYDNVANGISTNYNPALKLVNVEVYNNGTENIRLFTDKPQEYNYDVQGIKSYNGGAPDVVGSVTVNTEFKNNSEAPLLSPINFWQVADKKSVNSVGEVLNQ